MSDQWDYSVVDPSQINEHLAKLKVEETVILPFTKRDIDDMLAGKWIVLPWGPGKAVVFVLKELAQEHIMHIAPGKNGTVD